jgi:hypothetical protein
MSDWKGYEGSCSDQPCLAKLNKLAKMSINTALQGENSVGSVAVTSWQHECVMLTDSNI